MRNNRSFLAIGLLFAFSCLLSSCKPADIGADLPKITARELAESIIARAQPFSAKGVVRYKGGFLAFVEAEFLCDPKLGLRIDLFTPFGTPAAVFALRHDHAEFLSIGERLLIRGKSKDLASRIFKLDVDPGGLPWLLAGGLPPNLKGWRFESPEKKDPDVLILTAKDETGNSYHAVLQGKNYLVSEFVVYGPDSNEPLQLAECGNHLDGIAPIPRRLTLSGPALENDLEITLRDLEVGKGPDADILTLKSAPGVRVEDL